ncbi:MAG: 1-deoxy-D-xylulose-5-phosphate synthase [Bifidobacteriaceae bacterium]|jgi:1-deoxy-D-xylulose-5-phosphate synthase|nr:1-deoxy-D-xylulose-5-phosphate synthase [Bifidobacteriaceae bacterium]
MLSLDSYNFPDDLKNMNLNQLIKLSTNIRQFLVENVAKTGGHLGPNLGVVELTLAMFKVYDINKDSFIYDVGHQTYIHKILTGRTNFANLRQAGGMSGYPSRLESPFDILENSHASVSLSWADGIARANILQKNNSTTVVLVGDGALAGGMIWEAINHIAYSLDQKLVIVINDNGRAYGETVGGLAHHLSAITGSKTYYDLENQTKLTLKKMGNFGKVVRKIGHNFKTGVRSSVLPKRIFSDFDIRYLGPINGHNLDDVIKAMKLANRYKEPVIIHAITQKGYGFPAAVDDAKDQYHTIGKFNPKTGIPIDGHLPCWSHIMGKTLTKLATKNPKILALTAAMLEPVGLEDFAKTYPNRIFDVGIAEAHAVGFASGLVYKGYHPVFALYSTFANRAFDQLLFDAALHKTGMTLCLDRAGVTGDDGPSHNGIWDISLFSLIPNIQMSAVWDKKSLAAVLAKSVKIDNHITIIRYPKGAVLPNLSPVAKTGNIVYFKKSVKLDNLIIALGPLIHVAMDAAFKSRNTTVVSCIWFWPIDIKLVELAKKYKNIIIAEDGILKGGFGQSFLEKFNLSKTSGQILDNKITLLGISDGFQKVNSRENILRCNSLDIRGIRHYLKK